MVEFVAMPLLGATDPPSSPRAAGVPSRRRPASWRPALRLMPPAFRRGRHRRANAPASVAAASASCCIRSARCRALIVFGLSALSAFFRSLVLDFDFLAGAGVVVVNPLPMSKPPRPPGSSSDWSRPAISASSAAGSVAVASRVLRIFLRTASVASSGAATICWMEAMRASEAALIAVAESADLSLAWASTSAAINSGRSRATRLRAHAVAVGLRSDLTRFASSPSPAAMSSLASSSRAATNPSSGTP